MPRSGDAIYKRGNTWWLDFVHRGERHKVRIGSHIKRSVAREIAQVERAKILRGEAGIGRRRKDISFQEARARFERWLEINRRPHTVQSYKEALDRLSKAFDGKKLSQITTAELERYKESRVTGDRGKMSTNRELAVLSSLLNRCREWDVFEFCQGERENAASARRTNRFKENRGRIRFLEWEEEERLLAAAGEPLRTIILCGVDAGLRIEAEALTLRWSGLDFRRGMLVVESAYAKNHQLRSIPMTDRLKDALLKHRFRSGKQAPEDHVFVNRRGKPLRSIKNTFNAARDRAGLREQDVTPHVCRHTFGSRLAMAGTDVRTIQELMGHKRIEMTVRYTHVSEEHKAAALRTALVPPLPKVFPPAIPSSGACAEEAKAISP